MIHYWKTFHTYLFFAATLICLHKELQGLRAFGTCFIHCRRNIKERLHDQHFTESEIKNVLDDIFGCQHGNVFAEGLVDANSEGEKLETLQEQWKAIEERNPAI